MSASRRLLWPRAQDTSTVDVEVERRQRQLLARAQQQSSTAVGAERRPSRWSHVPLAELIGEHNHVYERGGAHLETGHEPIHGSRSGRCVLVDTGTGRWYCRSCGRSGDAAGWVMVVQDLSYAQAAAYLAERYGPPAGGRGKRRVDGRQSSGLTWRRVL
jgi:hypothetical protein